jgi:hypothetical protein
MAGYGKSDKPHGSSTHIEYSKRVMADDMVQLMYVLPSLLTESSPSPSPPLPVTSTDKVLMIGNNLVTINSV